MEKFKYSAPYLRKAQFMKESGLPRYLVDRMIWSDQGHKFTFRSSKGKTASVYIDTQKFQELMDKGAFDKCLA